MGFNPKKVEYYTVEDWRFVCGSVGAMRRWKWQVESECGACGVRLRVSLAIIILARGRETSLWGAVTRCKRVGCDGQARFWGKAPTQHGFIALTAPPGPPVQRSPDGEQTVVVNTTKGLTFNKPRSER